MQTLILALLILAGTLPNTQQAPWKEFSSAEGKFSAAMPDDPTTNAVATYTSKGRLLTHTVSSTDKELNQYLVSWTEYPEESIEQRATETKFDKIRDALVGHKGGKVLSESAVNQGHPAREVTFSVPENRVIRVRFYFVRNRFYQVMAESKGENSEAVERFFNSFKLLPGTLL